MQLTEFIMRNRENGRIRNLKAFIDPNAPLSEELGPFLDKYEILECYVIIKI